MNPVNILELSGGLALFLYGMNVMSDSLVHIAGKRIKDILHRVVSYKFAAVIFATIVTAVIQSSSASTVLTVGLVEAGMITLEESVSFIMGANVGTTMTSWLFAATGIAHNNTWLLLLTPETIAAVSAMTGLVLVLVSRSVLYRNIGNAIEGFAIMIYGIEIMTGAAGALSDNVYFAGLITLCDNPLYAVLAGAFITAVIQSSSASVGILQTLCISGNVPYSVAIPVIMGQNIGTCITTVLASLGTSVNSKRTAMIHLYYNVFGTVIFMGVFFIVRYTNMFEVLDEYATVQGIASFHSIFNIASVIVMYPLTGLLVKTAVWTVRDKEIL